MEAMRILMDEHQSLAAIIHALRYMIKEIAAGRLQPDFALLRAMVHYLDAYPEKRHHPKEEAYLFGPLRARTEQGNAALDKLEAEHALADERIARLAAALEDYAERADGDIKGFSLAFDAYAEFYRTHMLMEEREVLPLIRKHFTAEDWARADAGFLASEDPARGLRSSGEDFAHIFSRLVAATPAPIGHGAGPYRQEQAPPKG